MFILFFLFTSFGYDSLSDSSSANLNANFLQDTFYKPRKSRGTRKPLMSSITQTWWPRVVQAEFLDPLQPLSFSWPLWFKCFCVDFRQLTSITSLMYVLILELMYYQNRWALPDHLTSRFMGRVLPDGLGWEIQIRNHLIPVRVFELNVLPFELSKAPVCFRWLV